MSTAIPSDILRALEQALPNAQKPFSLHEPLFTGNEAKYVTSCIEEGWVSSVGAFVDRFEKDLAATCGAKHAVVVVNGTAALQIALYAMGVEPDDEVLIPSLTFVATANAVYHAGAIPHFVEVEETSLGIDPVKLDAYLARITTREEDYTVNKLSGRIIRALMPVDIFGHPCQLEALKKVAHKYNIELIQDATEALGSQRAGKPVGSEGIAVLSFNGNKIITTGGGGAILTDDDHLAKRLKHLTTTAKLPHKWAFMHDEPAWNFRMPNLNAALGCGQLETLPRLLKAKRALAAHYIKTFDGMAGAHILKEPEGTQSNYWLVTLLADKATPGWLDDTLTQLHAAGYLCRPIWTPLHQLPMYGECPRDDLSLTENLAQRIINLPSSAKLGLSFLS